MRRISSCWTWWNKKAFPVLWFGFLAIFSFVVLIGIMERKVPAPVLIFPFVMAAFGYAIMQWLVFSLVDEVWIQNDDLVVKNNGDEDCFPIRNVINVDSSYFSNPERIVLTLKEPCRFGREIVFSPPIRWLRFSRHPIAEELIRRARGFDENDQDALRYGPEADKKH